MSLKSHSVRALRQRARVRHCLLGIAFVASSALLPARTVAQQPSKGALASRADLEAAAADAERTAAQGKDRERNLQIATSIRERLKDGDFQIGDRIAVTTQIDTTHADTLVVRTGRVLVLSGGPPPLALAGVLRSELQPLVEGEILKYVKARRVEAVPLLRVQVMGEVARPNFYDFVSDIPLTTAIMAAGGPTALADMSRAVHRREGREIHSSGETTRAIDRGLTLDQFGFQAGDEIVIGKRAQFNFGQYLGYLGTISGLVGVYVLIRNTQRQPPGP
jgi:hypothetical protein